MQQICAKRGFGCRRRYVDIKGDMPVEEWMEKEAAGEIIGDFEVDALLAEKGAGTRRSFLVKWKVRPELYPPDLCLFEAQPATVEEGLEGLQDEASPARGLYLELYSASPSAGHCLLLAVAAHPGIMVW